ncbi:MAG TPA: HGxxPAAW family protein [Nocardioidaceae bacterium]|nr:HGxxPAAW family protein [Nocardioidaceae bacterium]
MVEAQRPAQRTAEPHHDDHGHSVAAWTLVTIVLLGVLVGCVALIANQPWLFWVGLGVIVVGVIAGKVLQVMGFGVKTYEQSPSEPNRPRGVR